MAAVRRPRSSNGDFDVIGCGAEVDGPHVHDNGRRVVGSASSGALKVRDTVEIVVDIQLPLD